MAGDSECCEHRPQSSPASQLGAGRYIGRVARSAELATCHLSTVVHCTACKLPAHAHDWPFLSTLLRGSYVSRTRTRELEFKHGVAVYHPRAYEHCDEIGRDGGIFFGIQLDPDFVQDADHARPDRGRDVAILDDSEAYIVLGKLYAALCSGADQLELESLAVELAGHQLAPKPRRQRSAPPWLRRTEQRLREEQRVSLRELSLDAGVHATTLTRIFRQLHDCSIGEFHARIRARRAFFEVVGSKAPLSEICHDTGYSDQSHMTRAFARTFATTPGQLRRSMLNA